MAEARSNQAAWAEDSEAAAVVLIEAALLAAEEAPDPWPVSEARCSTSGQ